ncbi:hypothetical protein AVEN_189024-1 [Araneus ventricosus]|uniref:Uncharacterized protein n=1 Tax=Araneus ventricosus TaxID=182803 RepID=A0A4Y2JXG7_ARAVE|nr:hypothetical protein AVEN_97388-1 [Araneus ventricosus]GBM94790.1 hypothetical protein AVEN_189024-1 [Araneus ventricosus]
MESHLQKMLKYSVRFQSDLMPLTESILEPRSKSGSVIKISKKSRDKNRLVFGKNKEKQEVGEVSKEVELSTLEIRYLAEPILTLPMSTLCDTSETEILSKC